MTNISKIIALTALITLAFGMTAINPAMAGGPLEVMVIKIYSDRSVTVTSGYPIQIGPQDLQGNPRIDLVGQKTIIGRKSGTVLWTNPRKCAWFDLDGVWKYVCWDE